MKETITRNKGRPKKQKCNLAQIHEQPKEEYRIERQKKQRILTGFHCFHCLIVDFDCFALLKFDFIDVYWFCFICVPGWLDQPAQHTNLDNIS